MAINRIGIDIGIGIDFDAVKSADTDPDLR